MAAAFRHAGAEWVLMTLWPIEDAASQRFMQRFYEHYLDGSESASSALRKAQLEFLESADPAHSLPRAWAGFALVGG